MIEASLSQLRDELDDVMTHRLQAEKEERWARESLCNLQRTYSHLKTGRVEIVGSDEDETEYEVVRPHVLLKKKLPAVDDVRVSYSDDKDDTKKTVSDKVSTVTDKLDDVLWTPKQIAYGKG